jgi:hypothetical protein
MRSGTKRLGRARRIGERLLPFLLAAVILLVLLDLLG